MSIVLMKDCFIDYQWFHVHMLRVENEADHEHISQLNCFVNYDLVL